MPPLPPACACWPICKRSCPRISPRSISAVVDAAYYLNILEHKDGRVLSGIVGAQSERTLTLRAVGQESVIDRQDIKARKIMPISLMPEGLLQAFTPEQQRDLLAYLMGNSQVPLAK
jgi:putative heme-binding domain-containing protein